LDEKTLKYIFSMFIVGIVASLQVVAWYLGLNGTVFAFTSLIIGVVAGSILGFTFNVDRSVKDFVDQQKKTP